MPPIERDETQPPTEPPVTVETVKHIPSSPNTAETQDSDPRPTVSHAHRSLQPGQTLSHYQLIGIVGEGAFGVVWKARDTQLDRSVAIKIPKHNYDTEREKSWFFREARAAAQLKHASIVAVYDVGQDSNVRYIVSEFVEGQSLTDFLKNKSLAPRAAVELCKQISDAVAHAHENGITHRDLKPSNILIDAAGVPHLLDFGLAKLEIVDQTLTADDLVLGTPGYMSPEQARGASRDSDARSDVYSLGVLLFQLLTRELPFRGTVHAVIRQHIEAPAPSPRGLDGRIPQDLESIVLRCLEKSPHHRFDDAKELSNELARYLSGQPLSFRPQGPVTRFIRWFLNNPSVARETTGIAYLLAGLVQLAWAAVGMAVVILGMTNAGNYLEAISELIAMMFLMGFPLILTGTLLLNRWPYSLWLAAFIASCGIVGCSLFGLGFVGSDELHGVPSQRVQVASLLFCFSVLLLTLPILTAISQHWNQKPSSNILET